MQQIFWIDSSLCGRCGPDTLAWNLAELKAAGIGAVLSVNQGTQCDPAEFSHHGIYYACIPLSPNAPPEPGDLEHNLQALPQAFEFIVRHQQAGLAVLVHCRSGKDRTGLMLAYYLMRTQGLSLEAALAKLLFHRPIALTATGWNTFAPEVLRLSFENGSLAADKMPE